MSTYTIVYGLVGAIVGAAIAGVAAVALSATATLMTIGYFCGLMLGYAKDKSEDERVEAERRRRPEQVIDIEALASTERKRRHDLGIEPA